MTILPPGAKSEICSSCAQRGFATFALLAGMLFFDATPGLCLDHVAFKRDGQTREVTGKVEITAEDGGLMLLSADGILWRIEPQEIVARTKDDAAFQPLQAPQLARQLLKELPPGFEAHTTTRYLVCHNTSREYAQWCGGLLERLNRAFVNFWTRKGFKLHESDFPLVAIVFADRASYVKFAEAEAGKGVERTNGFYSPHTNRMLMYDLTESSSASGGRGASATQINFLLSQPGADVTVSTIIHEATHQVAFNCGMQTRLADIPGWVSEGLAMYFETPDLESAKGWKTIGAVNYSRLEQFRRSLPSRGAGSLKSLIADEKRLHDPSVALDAYAEAWALTYFLLKQNSKGYVTYLQKLAEKPPLVWDEPETRLNEFREAFGDVDRLDREFARQMQKVH